MTNTLDTLRDTISFTDRLDRLMAIGWEDVGGLVLAMGAIAFMTALGALRSR